MLVVRFVLFAHAEIPAVHRHVLSSLALEVSRQCSAFLARMWQADLREMFQRWGAIQSVQASDRILRCQLPHALTVIQVLYTL